LSVYGYSRGAIGFGIANFIELMYNGLGDDLGTTCFLTGS